MIISPPSYFIDKHPRHVKVQLPNKIQCNVHLQEEIGGFCKLLHFGSGLIFEKPLVFDQFPHLVQVCSQLFPCFEAKLHLIKIVVCNEINIASHFCIDFPYDF